VTGVLATAVGQFRAPPLRPSLLSDHAMVLWARQTFASPSLQSDLCLVRSGLLVARYESEPGMAVAEILWPGDVIGEGIFGGVAPVSLTAATPATLAVLDAERVDDVLSNDHAASQWLMRAMAVRARRAQNRQVNLMTANTRARLSRLVLDWCESGSTVHVPGPFRGGVAQNVLAEVIGSTRHTVSRTLQDFDRRGVILLEESGVTVRKFDVLRRCARATRPYFHGVDAPGDGLVHAG
jgi:CRP/FNR family cyclic AMP-dependent transcriptional regulator